MRLHTVSLGVYRRLVPGASTCVCVCVCVQLCPTLCDPRVSSPPTYSVHGISGSNTRVGCYSLLQGIFPTQGLNPRLLHFLHWQADSLPLSYLGSPPACWQIPYLWMLKALMYNDIIQWALCVHGQRTPIGRTDRIRPLPLGAIHIKTHPHVLVPWSAPFSSPAELHCMRIPVCHSLAS